MKQDSVVSSLEVGQTRQIRLVLCGDMPSRLASMSKALRHRLRDMRKYFRSRARVRRSALFDRLAALQKRRAQSSPPRA